MRVSLLGVLLVFAFGCGGGSQGKIAKQISDQDKQKLIAFGDKEIKELTTEEQGTVVDIIANNAQKMLSEDYVKSICHSGSIALTNGDAQQCKEWRESCLREAGPQLKKFRSEFDANKEQFKKMMSQQLTQTNLKPSDVTLMFELVDDMFAMFDGFSCGSTLDDLQKAAQKLESKLVQKYGAEKLAQLQLVSKELNFGPKQ